MTFLAFTLSACGGAVSEPTDGQNSPDEDSSASTEAVSHLDPRSTEIHYNNCACLDLSEVEQCPTSGSTCTAYRGSGRDRHYCKDTKKYYYCPHYVAYTCRKDNYPPNGLSCCSGKAAYLGSTLDCIP